MLNSPGSRARIALLDDHDVVLYGLSTRIADEPDLMIVGVYTNSKDMVAGLRVHPADVLLIDYSLGPTEIDGVTLIRALRSKFPESRVLVVSAHFEPATVALALRVGAHGFVGKDQEMREIVHAVRTVAMGKTYLTAEMAYELSDMLPAQSTPGGVKQLGTDWLHNHVLSVREREVIRCFLDGLTVTQIAEKFNRSAKTISTQKSTAFRKLGIRSDHELFKMKDDIDGV